jgi:hypothetical protein
MSDSTFSPESPKKKMSLGKKVGLGFLVFFVFSFILGAIGSGTSTESSSGTSGSSSSNSSAEKPKSSPWYTSDYSEAEDGIAFKWTKGGCDFGRCGHASLIVKDGCSSSLYVEVTEFDKSGAQIGYSNDAVGAVAPMQTVKMTFNVSDETANMNLSKISCY